MTGKTHLAGGFAAGAGLAYAGAAFTELGMLLPPTLDVAGLAVPGIVPGLLACGIASLLPDIDEPESLIANSPENMKRRIGRGRAGIDRGARQSAGMLLTVLNVITRGLAGFVRLLAGGHRGATHMLLIAAALTIGMYFLGEAIGFAALWLWFAVGYLSHLLLDMLTPSGLALLWPLSRRPLHLLPGPLRIVTGGVGDVVVRIALLGIGVWVLYRLYM